MDARTCAACDCALGAPGAATVIVGGHRVDVCGDACAAALIEAQAAASAPLVKLRRRAHMGTTQARPSPSRAGPDAR